MERMRENGFIVLLGGHQIKLTAFFMERMRENAVEIET
jgi:hypothetical protein